MIKDINNVPLLGNEIGPLEVGEDLTVICEVAGGMQRSILMDEKEAKLDEISQVHYINFRISGTICHLVERRKHI